MYVRVSVPNEVYWVQSQQIYEYVYVCMYEYMISSVGAKLVSDQYFRVFVMYANMYVLTVYIASIGPLSREGQPYTYTDSDSASAEQLAQRYDQRIFEGHLSMSESR